MAFGVVVTKRPLSRDIYDTPLLISMGTLIGDTQGLAHHGEHTAHGITDKKKRKSTHQQKKQKRNSCNVLRHFVKAGILSRVAWFFPSRLSIKSFLGSLSVKGSKQRQPTSLILSTRLLLCIITIGCTGSSINSVPGCKRGPAAYMGGFDGARRQ